MIKKTAILLELLLLSNFFGCIRSNERHSLPVTILSYHKAEHWFSEKKDIEFCRAIEMNDTRKIGKMLKEGVDINKRGKGGVTFLVYAFFKQKKASFKYLIENGADYNVKINTTYNPTLGGEIITDKYKNNFFKMVVYDRDPFYLEMCLKNGANPNYTEPAGINGEITVHILNSAVMTGLTNVILLIEYGANPDGVGNGAPLEMAISSSDFDIAYYLLQKGANPDLEKENIIYSITNFFIVRWKAKKESLTSDIIKQIEYRDKVIEMLEERGYKFPDRVKKWNWTNE